MVRLTYLRFTILLLLTGLFSACETDITVDLPEPEEKIVVEGSIEQDQPPLVLVTRNQPFFGAVDLNSLETFFVADATVTVTVDGVETQLDDVCLSDIPADLRPAVSQALGIPLNEDGEFDVDICIYTKIDNSLIGEVGKSYSLKVERAGLEVNARTTIPDIVGLDSIWFTPHPDPEVDSLVSLRVAFTDPDTLGNFYRYFTQQNSESFFPGFNSVFDDLFVNGQSFDFSLDRGQSRNADFDFDTYGYFWKGDTIVLRWCSIDKRHYDFWSSIEFDSGAQGPLSSVTIAATNIEGPGLGVWGGYGAYYDTLIVVE